MKFAVVHCPNPKCRLKVWVPEKKLGIRGRCPKCGHSMLTPPTVPTDELAEGPAVLDTHEESDIEAVGVAI
jgi:hypothetical protein